MERLLFTIPGPIAKQLKELLPSGQRSRFVVQHIEIPLKELQKKANKKKSPYKASFLKDIAKAKAQIKRGEVYSHEEVMKEFGL